MAGCPSVCFAEWAAAADAVAAEAAKDTARGSMPCGLRRDCVDAQKPMTSGSTPVAALDPVASETSGADRRSELFEQAAQRLAVVVAAHETSETSGVFSQHRQLDPPNPGEAHMEVLDDIAGKVVALERAQRAIAETVHRSLAISRAAQLSGERMESRFAELTNRLHSLEERPDGVYVSPGLVVGECCAKGFPNGRQHAQRFDDFEQELARLRRDQDLLSTDNAVTLRESKPQSTMRVEQPSSARTPSLSASRPAAIAIATNVGTNTPQGEGIDLKLKLVQQRLDEFGRQLKRVDELEQRLRKLGETMLAVTPRQPELALCSNPSGADRLLEAEKRIDTLGSQVKKCKAQGKRIEQRMSVALPDAGVLTELRVGMADLTCEVARRSDVIVLSQVVDQQRDKLMQQAEAISRLQSQLETFSPVWEEQSQQLAHMRSEVDCFSQLRADIEHVAITAAKLSDLEKLSKSVGRIRKHSVQQAEELRTLHTSVEDLASCVVGARNTAMEECMRSWQEQVGQVGSWSETLQKLESQVCHLAKLHDCVSERSVDVARCNTSTEGLAGMALATDIDAVSQERGHRWQEQIGQISFVHEAIKNVELQAGDLVKLRRAVSELSVGVARCIKSTESLANRTADKSDSEELSLEWVRHWQEQTLRTMESQTTDIAQLRGAVAELSVGVNRCSEFDQHAKAIALRIEELVQQCWTLRAELNDSRRLHGDLEERFRVTAHRSDLDDLARNVSQRYAENVRQADVLQKLSAAVSELSTVAVHQDELQEVSDAFSSRVQALSEVASQDSKFLVALRSRVEDHERRLKIFCEAASTAVPPCEKIVDVRRLQSEVVDALLEPAHGPPTPSGRKAATSHSGAASSSSPGWGTPCREGTPGAPLDWGAVPNVLARCWGGGSHNCHALNARIACSSLAGDSAGATADAADAAAGASSPPMSARCQDGGTTNSRLLCSHR
mmetsp:Transcript_30784/g.89409  ORF Transcript_30784/g.89409 Transcript_30784/m.89409 type:complete len:958 (+) Transcript_30784:60-2933(+)